MYCRGTRYKWWREDLVSEQGKTGVLVTGGGHIKGVKI